LKAVTYHTPSYAQYADKFKASCAAVNLPCLVRELPFEFQSWSEAVLEKPEFLWEMLVEHGEVLWLDVDSEVREYPTMALAHDRDVAVYFDRPGDPWAGTLFLRDSARTRSFLTFWTHLLAKHQPPSDQEVLDMALKLSGVSINRLPPSYHWIERKMRRRFGAAVPVIEHHMAHGRTIVPWTAGDLGATPDSHGS